MMAHTGISLTVFFNGLDSCEVYALFAGYDEPDTAEIVAFLLTQ